MTAKKRKPTRKNTRRARGHRTSRERPSAPYRNGDIARVPVTAPAGASTQSLASSGPREIQHNQRFRPVPGQAKVPANIPTLAQYLTDWLADTVRPNLDLATYAYYEVMVRRYIIPTLGGTRLDQLQLREVQAWLDQLATQCQCCVQGKDAARVPRRQRCCAIGECCGDYPGPRTIQAARNTLRAVLNHAKEYKLVPRNVAAFAQVPGLPKRSQRPVWTVEDARRFLDSAHDRDPLYPAYVLVLVNGLTRSEVLGLIWPSIDLESGELETGWQLQRIHGELLHRRRTLGNDADGTLSLPDICVAALRVHRERQHAARERAGDRWQASDLVFTTRWGTPVEPRNFYRSFQARCVKAGVTLIRVRDIRHTSPALLAALDDGVHADQVYAEQDPA